MNENKRSNPFMYCGDTVENDMTVIGNIDGKIILVDKVRGHVYELERGTLRLVPVKLKVVED